MNNLKRHLVFNQYERQYYKMHACSVASDSLHSHGLCESQALLSMEFSQAKIQVGCHCLLQGIFPTQGLNLLSPALAERILYHCGTWEALIIK